MQILVAEDDTTSAKLLVWILEEEGYEVLTFPDGKKALEYFKSNPTPVVISDWMMPEMDGLELCKQIRGLELENYTHFILLTAKTGQESYRKAMEAGVDDFLSKPVDQEELTIRLRVAERIIQQRTAAEATIRSLARFSQDNPNPVIQVDSQARIKYTNHACEPLLVQWNLEDNHELPDQLKQLLEAAHQHDNRHETEIACGEQTYSFAVTSVYNGDTTYIYGHNITARKKAEGELLALKNKAVETALHDQLTGLPNRVYFRDHLDQCITRSRRHGNLMGLVMVDLDNFKTINDSQGHQTGDAVLTLVGNTIKSALRESDTVCRWGGDELMIILPDLLSRDSVPMICNKIASTLRQRLANSQITVPVTLSMGFALFPKDADDQDLLIQQADYALYEAKAEGRNCWREFKGFAKGQETRGVAELYLRLSDAIESQLVTAHYQPVVDANTHRVVGIEALARWNDGHNGWIAPDMFIPMAEEKGLINALGQQVATHGLETLQGFQQRNIPITISLNLSKLQLLDPEFHPWMLASVQRLGLDPGSVMLEVTERQSLLTHELCRQRLEDFSASGFKLSLDDFGTGYASLDLVAEMPFDELKIPRALVRSVDTKRGRRIVQAIAEMAKTLGLDVVAEGVETESVVESLQEIGVHKLQGYYFSKALSLEKLNQFLANHPHESKIIELNQAA